MSRSDDAAYRPRLRGAAVERDLGAVKWDDRQREVRQPSLRGTNDPQPQADDLNPYEPQAGYETQAARRDAGLRADVNRRGASERFDNRAPDPRAVDPRGQDARYLAHDPRGIEPDLGGPAYNEPAYNEPAYNEPAYNEPAYNEPAYNEPAYDEPVYGDPEPVEPAWDGRSQQRGAALPDPYARAYADPRGTAQRDAPLNGRQSAYDEAGYAQPGYAQPGQQQPGYDEAGYDDPNGYQPSVARTNAGYEAGYEDPGYVRGHQAPEHAEPALDRGRRAGRFAAQSRASQPYQEPAAHNPTEYETDGYAQDGYAQDGYAPESYAEPAARATSRYAQAEPAADPRYGNPGGQAEPAYYDEFAEPAEANAEPYAQPYDAGQYDPRAQQQVAYERAQRHPGEADPYAEPAYDDAAQYDQHGNYIGDGQAYADPQYAEQGYDDAVPADYADQHEKAARPRSRMGLVIGGALAAAIAVGGGLGLAYNLLSGGSNSGEPTKIAADRSPAKAQPAERGGKVFDNQGKQVYERLGGGTGNTAGNRVVSGEQPAVSRPSAGITVLGASPSQPGISIATSREVYAPATGSETVTSLRSSQQAEDPNALRRVPTVMVRPGEKITATAPELQLAPSVQPAPRPTLRNGGGSSAALPGLTTADSGLAPLPEPSPSLQRNVARVAAAPTAVRAPAAAPVQVAVQAPRTAAPQPAATTASVGSSGYVAQVVSSKSRLEALAAFADMQQRYGNVLTGKEHDIQEVDLGTRGRWYRLRIGPPASKESASQLCASLKQAGLRDCLTRPY